MLRHENILGFIAADSKGNLYQGSQTQSVMRVAWDWTQGLAGSIKKWMKIFERISYVFWENRPLTQYFF